MNSKTKRFCSIGLVICLICSLFAGSAYATKLIFADSVNHWAEKAINELADKGILYGYPDGLVHPDELITRGEFASLVARTMKLPNPDNENVTIVFKDIAGHFAEKDIEALVIAGIIGKDDFGERFCPDEPITRIEMIRMLIKAIGKGEHSKDCSCNTGFADDDLLTEEQYKYVCAGKHYCIICGFPDGTVRPNDVATRGEAFEMLVSTEKAKEQIKEQESKPPVDKPATGDSSSSGGGSSTVPAPQFSFILPANAYKGDEIKLEPTSRYVKSVVWTVRKDGVSLELDKVLNGVLNENGGSISFLDTGNFVLTATAVNSRGKEIKHEQSIHIYPIITTGFSLPKTAHTDTAVSVDLKTTDLGSNRVIWTLKKEGSEVDLADALNGELEADGGIVVFKNKGSYVLTASIADELGKTVSASQTITIYPVAQVKVTLPTVSHTDKTINFYSEVTDAEDMTVDFSLTRNGEPVQITDYVEGELNEGSIRFKEKGVYALTVIATDKTDRIFTDTANITVYPVGSVGFYLPEIFHTDSKVTLQANFSEIGNHTAEWTLTKNDKPINLQDVISGGLTNAGGTVQFKEQGSYVLKAAFTDNGGRNYSHEQGFKVYPVPTVRYSLPQYAHTDSDIAIKAQVTALDDLNIEWLVDNTYGFQDFDTYVDGKLSNEGGTIRFKRAGIYELVARVTDETGRVFLFELGGKCEVLPVLSIGFELPALAYTDSTIDIRTHGNNNVLPVEWSLSKDEKTVSLGDFINGTLNAQGGKVGFRADGEYTLTATMTDFLKRSYSHSQTIRVLPVISYDFILPNTIHYGIQFTVTPKNISSLGSNSVVWTLNKDGEHAEFTGALTNDGGEISIHHTGTFTLTAAVTDSAGRSFSQSHNITVTNTAPNTPMITATPTRTVKDGKFLVNVNAAATDPDGDDVILEWDGTTADSYYPVGSHTIRVRAKDDAGAYSDWISETFTITNAAPSVPTINRTPSGNSVIPGTPVTITAQSSDSDGDAITYIWENRKAETQVYPLGKNVVRVKAVDSTGAESPWSAIVFFVMDSNGSGGMMLTGPDSVILENGIEDATIRDYTFTVPPVSGHNGSDYGRVKGYNTLTKQWDQLDYGTTNNGITFQRTLEIGVYSKLEFYYYTNHNCMYNKSNITYSVTYHFE